jgi:restriction endonuclease S subunit
MKKYIKDIAKVQVWYYFRIEKKWDINYLQSSYFDDYGDLKEKLIPEIKSEEIQEKYLLKEWDILFSAKGNRNFATVYKNEYWPSIASSTFFIVKLFGKNLLPEYLVILLNESQKTNYFLNNFSGSTIKSIPKNILEEFEINIPSIEKQKQVVNLYNLYKEELKIYEKLRIKKELLVNKIILESNK